MPIDLDDPIALMLVALPRWSDPALPVRRMNVFRRAVTGSLRGQEILATPPEDFVILKVLATRERDPEDARSVIETQRTRLGLALVRTEIEQLIDEIPDHDVRGRFARLSTAVCRSVGRRLESSRHSQFPLRDCAGIRDANDASARTRSKP